MQEVKDTLDKKAIIGLMTECYEMHQPDKKKIEELKNISLGIDALPTQTTMKSFSQAQSFFKGMVRFEKEEPIQPERRILSKFQKIIIIRVTLYTSSCVTLNY